MASEAESVAVPSSPGLGIAFGGGVARGYFLFGAWKALQEAGIQFDCFAGSSCGSIAAAAFAGGATAEQLEELSRSASWFQDVFHLKNSFKDLGLSVLRHLSWKGGQAIPPGLLESSRLADLLNRVVEQKGFSSVKKLILTAADIVTGDKILFCSPEVARMLRDGGKLSVDLPPGAPSYGENYLCRDVIVPFEDVGLAVRASCCFPSAFSSVQVDCPDLDGGTRTRMLNDGGICEQMPVKPLKALGCRKVLAVFLGFLPQFKEVNHFVAVSANAIQFLIRTQVVESLRMADYVLYDPRIEDASLVKLDPDLIQLGYEFTRERIPEIRQALGLDDVPAPDASPDTAKPGAVRPVELVEEA